ncbi:MAG: serine hydrolase [Gaiellaceae bacterium]
MSSALLSPPDSVAGDRELVLALQGVTALDRAGELAAGGRGGPDAVQRQYDLARDLEESVVAAEPVNDGCRALARVLRSLARAHVRQAEGVDRKISSVVKAGLDQAAIARQGLADARARCRPRQPAPTREQMRQLLEPAPGDAFFGDVTAVAPPGADTAEVLVNGTRWGDRISVRGRIFRVRLAGRPRKCDVEVRFFDSTGALVSSARADGVWLLERASARAKAAGRRSPELSASLTAVAQAFEGHVAAYRLNLLTGVYGAWNADAKFPAASLVKVGVMLAAVERLGARPDRSKLAYDLAAMTTWSSNLAANRLLGKLGGPAAIERLFRRLGALGSTYPGPYRVGTSISIPEFTRLDAPDPPPRVSARTTTAADMARLLWLVHAGATGNGSALTTLRLGKHQARYALGLLLSSKATGENVALFRRALDKRTPLAQKNGWLQDARHTAAIVYRRGLPEIVVVLIYKRGLALAEAERVGARMLSAG